MDYILTGTDTILSLNDYLLTGPCRYPGIPDVLLRFRRHRVAMTADVSKMFREVSLDPKDTDFYLYETH